MKLDFENKSPIHKRYSDDGLFLNMLIEEQVDHPHPSKIVGKLSLSFSQSTITCKAVPRIPGTITSGAQGPALKASRRYLVESFLES